MRKFINLVSCMLLATVAIGQTTVHFKPGPSVGEDAMVWELDGNCIPTGYSNTPATINYGSVSEVDFAAWTWDNAGCDSGLTRELMRFTGLNTIPPNATITNAILKLKTPSTTLNWGNSFPVINPPTNPGYVKRVLPGVANNWNESTITWNSALSLSLEPNAASWATVPVTGSRWNYTQNIDVTNIISAIESDLSNSVPYANNGFLLMLQNEIHYRQQCYASSDHTDSTMWPELIVTYTVCDPSFSYCANSNTPYTYTFTANATQVNYLWTINGTNSGTTPSINHTFPSPGSYNVCLIVTNPDGTECKKCIALCIDRNGQSTFSARSVEKSNKNKGSKNILKNRMLRSDNPLSVQSQSKIIPNPTQIGWNVVFNVPVQGNVSIVLSDMLGKKIRASKQKITTGTNNIFVSAKNLSKGVYFIQITGAGVRIRQKAVKN